MKAKKLLSMMSIVLCIAMPSLRAMDFEDNWQPDANYAKEVEEEREKADLESKRNGASQEDDEAYEQDAKIPSDAKKWRAKAPEMQRAQKEKERKGYADGLLMMTASECTFPLPADLRLLVSQYLQELRFDRVITGIMPVKDEGFARLKYIFSREHWNEESPACSRNQLPWRVVQLTDGSIVAPKLQKQTLNLGEPSDYGIAIRNIQTGKKRLLELTGKEMPEMLTCLPDNHFAYFLRRQNKIEVVDATTGKRIAFDPMQQLHEGMASDQSADHIMDIAAMANGNLATVSLEGNVRVWNSRNGQCVHHWELDLWRIGAVVPLEDNILAVYIVRKDDVKWRSIYLFDLNNSAQLKKIYDWCAEWGSCGIVQLLKLPNNRLAILSTDHVLVIDLLKKERVCEFSIKHLNDINLEEEEYEKTARLPDVARMTLLENGLLATTCADGYIRLWDIERGVEKYRTNWYRSFACRPWAVTQLSDGSLIASIGYQTIARWILEDPYLPVIKQFEQERERHKLDQALKKECSKSGVMMGYYASKILKKMFQKRDS